MGKFSKDKRDIYYRKAKEVGYRARSAFKLLQIARHFDIFTGVTRVVDLCAAPGGWTEVLSQHLATGRTTSGRTEHQPRGQQADAAAASSSVAAASDAVACAASSSADAAADAITSPVTIVAVDLQAMAPLPGVIVIQGDLTRSATAVLIRSALGVAADGTEALAELVVCDGAPDVIGMHDIDEAIQYELLLAAFNISLHILTEGGCFVAKIFRGKDVNRMYALFRVHFEVVTISKPKTCRNSSIEGFVVCQRYRGLTPERKACGLDCPVTLDDAPALIEPVQFVSCWDEEGLDADMSYPLSYTFPEVAARERERANEPATSPAASASSYQNLTASQLPIDPPYKRSLEMKKLNQFQAKGGS